MGGQVPSGKLILIAQPDQRKLLETSAGSALVRCWRLLFHARVHLAIQERIADGSFNSAALPERIHEIGEVEFDEIRTVLGQEGYLLPPSDDRSIYEEFAAVFWELRYFAWNALPRYFPCLQDLDAAAAVLSQDVDAHWLYLTTRPLGAPDPVDRSASDDLGAWTGGGSELPSRPARTSQSPSASKYRRLMRKARRAESLGNVVGGDDLPRQGLALRAAGQGRAEQNRGKGRRESVDRPAGDRIAAFRARRAQPWHDSLRGSGRCFRPTDTGPPRPACCTICKKFAWTTNGRFPRSIWWGGCFPSAGGRSSGLCPTSATCSRRNTCTAASGGLPLCAFRNRSGNIWRH